MILVLMKLHNSQVPRKLSAKALKTAPIFSTCKACRKINPIFNKGDVNFFYTLYVVLDNIEIFVESPDSRASILLVLLKTKGYSASV